MSTTQPSNFTDEDDKQNVMSFYENTHDEDWFDDTWNLENDLNTWKGIETNEQGRIIEIVVSFDHGIIPKEIGKLSELEVLATHQSGISGKIPSEIGNLKNLKYLHLTECFMSGPIPKEICNLVNLRVLELFEWCDRNEIIGQKMPGNIIHPEIGKMVNLEELTLSDINLMGPIPHEIGNLSKLTTLDLSGNKLSGPIPTELSNLLLLKTLMLNGNQLTGTMPDEVKNLPKMKCLCYHHNLMEDEIPNWKS